MKDKDQLMTEEKQKTTEITAPAPIEMLLAADISALEIAKLNRKIVLVQAEKALAQNEAAELSFRYVALQIFMKYGLNPGTDTINENGQILRGSLVKGVE